MKYLVTDLKTSFKAYFILFLALIGYVFVTFFQRIFGSSIISLTPFWDMVFLNLIFFFWSSYVFKNFVYSKTYHVIQSYTNPSSNYSISLEKFNSVKSSIPQNSFLNKTALFCLGLFLNLIFIYSLNFGTLVPLGNLIPSHFQPFIALLVIFELGPILIIGLLFATSFKPFYQYFSSTNSFSTEDIKNSQKKLEEWKNTIKFYGIELTLIQGYGIMMELTFFILFIVGAIIVLIFSFIGILSATNAVGVTSLNLLVTIFTLFIVIILVGFFSLLFFTAVEVEGSLIGAFYGEITLRALNINLNQYRPRYFYYQPIYCYICGVANRNSATFCTRCGNNLYNKQRF